jgi:hypothetical protein
MKGRNLKIAAPKLSCNSVSGAENLQKFLRLALKMIKILPAALK